MMKPHGKKIVVIRLGPRAMNDPKAIITAVRASLRLGDQQLRVVPEPEEAAEAKPPVMEHLEAKCLEETAKALDDEDKEHAAAFDWSELDVPPPRAIVESQKKYLAWLALAAADLCIRVLATEQIKEWMGR